MSAVVPNGLSNKEATRGLRKRLAEPDGAVKACVEGHGILYDSWEVSVVGKALTIPALGWFSRLSRHRGAGLNLPDGEQAPEIYRTEGGCLEANTYPWFIGVLIPE